MIRAPKKLETGDLVAYRDGVLESRHLVSYKDGVFETRNLVSYKNDGIHEQAL